LTIPRLYFPEKVEKGERRVLGGENLHYVKSVLRMRNGDRLFLFDGAGCESEALIREFTARGVIVEIVKKEEEKVRDEAVKITLFQALPKANKMDSIIRKGTELGVDAIIPFHSVRSIPRLSPETALIKRSRWQKIAAEAARQCCRSRMPEIGGILSFAEVLGFSQEGALRIIFWEGESETGIRQVLKDERHEGIKDFVVIIGPEGGFLKEEVDMAVAKGFISVGLGRQILKVETASLTILSILQYEKGIFNIFNGSA
jgi:16S rRNA (uracil1498-N3)-methyltransferase